MHLYLAGPYRPFDYPGAKGTSEVEQNVARASDVAAQCFDAGHAPINDTLLDAATYGVIGKLLRNDQWGH